MSAPTKRQLPPLQAIPTRDLCVRLGITKSRLEHWRQTGKLKLAPPAAGYGPGRGNTYDLMWSPAAYAEVEARLDEIQAPAGGER